MITFLSFTIQPGAIDKFGVDSQQMIETVARKTEENGNIEEAVFLYDLAGVTGNLKLITNLVIFF